VYSTKEIREYRKKIFRVLTDNGLEAVANIELTRGEDWEPNNCVHFHLITDDPRSEEELRLLLEMACERQGLVKDTDFCITYQKLYDGYWRFSYFTKFGKKYFYSVILFEKNLGLDKFYEIGKWFHKPQVQIWEDIITFMREKNGSDIEKTGNPDDPDNSDDIDLPSTDGELSCESLQENYIDLSADDIPTTTSIDFIRYFMRERYGIDIDEVTDGNEAITRLFVLSVGKFRKFPQAGWFCMATHAPFPETPPIITPNVSVQTNTSCRGSSGDSGG
jgi:hypothetical protein